MFSVPKRNFKHAVHRNVLKRRMREAFRLNRSSVEAEWPIVAERGLVVVLIYIGRAELNYPRIEGAMRQIIRHICKNTIDSVNSLT
jgi:ribonuclease P protein component